MIIDYTFLLVLQGAALLGIVAGIMGVFALLRQQSLLGDALSHAALPGIVMMFLLTYSKQPLILLCGGGVVGILGVWIVECVLHHTTLKKDAVLGIILSVFFGFGLVLMTIAQKYANSGQAILNKFLFGSVATLLSVDVLVIQVLVIVVLGVVMVLWKEISLYVFDPLMYSLCGFSTRYIEVILTTLLVISIMIGLQAVGVVLMSTMLIAPAAAARQWTQHLSHMIVVSALFGGISAATGVYVSTVVDHVPTGPAIVVVASCIAILSLICAPQRGK